MRGGRRAATAPSSSPPWPAWCPRRSPPGPASVHACGRRQRGCRPWTRCPTARSERAGRACAAAWSSFGYIRETVFGGLWSLSAELKEHDDTAYSTQYLEPHTDSTYSHDAPGLQCFLCQEFDGKGGESILVDGFALAEEVRAEAPELFRVLCEVSVPGRYIEPGVHLRTERPAIRLDGAGRLQQVSFNNYDRAPFLLEPARMKAFYRAYKEFHDRIVERRNWLAIPLRPGMALVFDNWRLLHGRLGYAGKRVFCGCYHNHEDFESALRSIA